MDYLFKGSILFLLISIVACSTESNDTQKEQAASDEELAAQSIQDKTGEDPSAINDTVAGGGSGGVSSSAPAVPPPVVPPIVQAEILAGLTVTDYVVVSTTRTGRTTMQYVLRLKISNASTTTYENVLATLLAVPAHITILDAFAMVGEVPANSTILSQDTFTIEVDLALNTSFDDLVWQIEGDVVNPPPPPSGSGPTEKGYFLSIDGNLIPGESTSESHQDWIELTALMEGLHREGVSAGSTRRRSAFVFDGVQVMKLVDRSSPKLREALAEGTVFGEVKIDVIDNCDRDLYTAYAITLSTARLDALDLHGEESGRPSEELGFNYTRIETMVTPVAADCTLLPPVFSTQDGQLLGL